jgi:predicted AAA+ superfamily ATPase
MIERSINIKELIRKSKVLLIYGARRVGKTTLLDEFLNSTDLKYKKVSGDDFRIVQLLSSLDFKEIADFVGDYELIAIDEAQNIPNIGKSLKIIVDNHPDIFIIATGSSSFEINQEVGEPLTGRKISSTLYPMNISELRSVKNLYEIKQTLPDLLVYGSYPEVITNDNPKDKEEILFELFSSYLLKDVLAYDNIRSSGKLMELLKLLAFQVGNLVSLNEIATQIHIDVKTIARYIDLLEKTFVIFKLSGYSRNLRSEVTSKSKYYFVDNGIRNVIINQFNSLETRNDVGALFENFVVTEIVKAKSYSRDRNPIYFWRNYGGNEIDIIEDKRGKLSAYEIKWSESAKVRKPKTFLENYPDSDFNIINSGNFLNLILERY